MQIIKFLYNSVFCFCSITFTARALKGAERKGSENISQIIATLERKCFMNRFAFTNNPSVQRNASGRNLVCLPGR
jgi:hypothetical protein